MNTESPVGTIAVLCTTNQKEWWIIGPDGSRRRHVLIKIDNRTGALGPPQALPSRTAALTSLGIVPEDVTAHCSFFGEYKSLVGMTHLPGKAILIAISEVNRIADLPVAGGPIFQVRRSNTVVIPLDEEEELPTDSSYCSPGAIEEAAAALNEVPLDNTHFFAPDSDLSLPFPDCLGRSPYSVGAARFDWNEGFRAPFRALGCEYLTCVLFRGFVSGCVNPCLPENTDGGVLPHSSSSKADVHFVLVERKDNRNPGTRYIGRGLNERLGAGNEFECELVAWTSAGKPDVADRWASTVWYRGTVPIRFKTEIPNYLGGVRTVVDSTADNGTLLAAYLHALMECTPTVKSDGSAAAALQIVDLLQRSKEDGEAELSETYEAAVTRIAALDPRWRPPLPSWMPNSEDGSTPKARGTSNDDFAFVGLRYLHFDWHQRTSEVGSLEAGCELWMRLGPLVNLGTDCIAAGDLPQAPSNPHPHFPEVKPPEGRMRFKQAAGRRSEPPSPAAGTPMQQGMGVRQRQRKYLRWNCLDCLDRTNIASFFPTAVTLLQLLDALQVRVVDVRSTLVCMCATASSRVPEPHGDGRAEHCRLTEEALEYYRNHLQSALHWLVSGFVGAGDVISELCTGTPAMHTSVIRDLVPELPNSAPPNAWISVNRRVQNIFFDRKRDLQSLLLLLRHPAQRHTAPLLSQNSPRAFPFPLPTSSPGTEFADTDNTAPFMDDEDANRDELPGTPAVPV